MTTALAIATKILLGLLVLEHIWALVLEMFLWTHPIGLRAFGNTPENARTMAVLAKNQGLYNGFLAAGLAWGLLTCAAPIQLFFTGCVLVAGVYGFATTGKRTILVGQGALGALTLATILVGR
jgi:putative membrane protein